MRINADIAPRIPIEIVGIESLALFDSGADRSILSVKLFDNLPAYFKKLRVDCHVSLFAVGKASRSLNTCGEITLPVVYKGQVIQQRFIISDEISDACILGWDAIIKHGFILNGCNQSIDFKKAASADCMPQSFLMLNRKVAISPGSAVTCTASIKGPTRKGLFLFTPLHYLPEGLQVDSFVQEMETSNSFPIRVRNLSDKNILLPRKFIVGIVEFDCTVKGNVNSLRVEQAHQGPNESLEQPLIVDKKYEAVVRKILANYTDLIASSNAELGSTGLVKHHIDTQGHQPIRQRPYRSSRKDKGEIEKLVKEMYNAGIIQDSRSPWAAPVILVEKKGGEKRFCVDFRKLNVVTKKDSYPLPRIDDTLDSLYGMKFFTTIDLASGYWQIELDEESKEKTAFIIDNELYEFTRMPFGLCNAPATFQRLMNQALRGVIGKKALVYLDDVIIFSKSAEDHERDLQEVFYLLRKAGLRIKLKKCQFFKKSVEYLGHVISDNGIQPDPGKIEKIKNYPTPKSVDEISSFLGLAGYYRRFIPNYGSIAKPLNQKKTKECKDTPFEWTADDQAAFDKLRTALITPPILAYPDFAKEFILFTDACDYGIGAVLSQEQENGEVVIAYASRQLRKPELKYATVEKEALAVVFAIKQFRHYLSGAPFKVVSDHCPLQWLAKQKDNNGRLGRWAVLLESFDYKIVYRPGKKHQNADCLSRLRVSAISAGPVNDTSLLINEQAKDALCQNIRSYLSNGILTETVKNSLPIWVKEIELFFVKEGILLRRDSDSRKRRRNEEQAQIVLPYSLRRPVLRELHDDSSAGHLAFIRTFRKVSALFYWPDIRKDIKEYCDTCPTCVANTKSRVKALLHPHELATAPFQVIGIDFLGPIKPPSLKGNTFIMVITDYFSKWVEAIAMPNQTALATAETLYNTIIQRHGPPKAIVTDRGTNFTSRIFKSLCDRFGIRHRLTTAYHPASNGETERFNRTLTSMLRKILKDGLHQNWEDLLGDVCFAYRSTVHESTLETPYFLVHGRDPNFKISNFLEPPLTLTPTASDYVANLVNRLRYSFQRAREENEKARKRQKEQYDKRAVNLQYKIGDRVLLDVRVVNEGDSRKFTSYFRGPYRVVKVFDNRTVEIADEKYVIQRVHVNRLKPLLETMLWRDEPCPEFAPDTNFNNREGQEHIEALGDLQNASADPFRPSSFFPPFMTPPDNSHRETRPITDLLTETNEPQLEVIIPSPVRPEIPPNIVQTQETTQTNIAGRVLRPRETLKKPDRLQVSFK